VAGLQSAAFPKFPPPLFPPVISNGAGRFFSSPFTPVKRVGLRREKSLFSLYSSRLCSGDFMSPCCLFCHPERSEGSAFAPCSGGPEPVPPAPDLSGTGSGDPWFWGSGPQLRHHAAPPPSVITSGARDLLLLRVVAGRNLSRLPRTSRGSGRETRSFPPQSRSSRDPVPEADTPFWILYCLSGSPILLEERIQPAPPEDAWRNLTPRKRRARCHRNS
jgi:hypothetical protein